MTLSEKVSAGMLVLVLGVLGASWWQDRHREPALPDSTRALQDSLRRTAPAFDSSVAVRLATASRDSAEVRRLARASRTAQDAAGREKARGDSLAALVAQAGTLADSAALWHGLADARGAEATSLRQALDTTTAALATSERRADSLGVVAAGALHRLDAANRVNLQLDDALRKMTECRVGLGVASLPCPSRRTAAIGGAVVALVGVVALRR